MEASSYKMRSSDHFLDLLSCPISMDMLEKQEKDSDDDMEVVEEDEWEVEEGIEWYWDDENNNE